MPKPNAIPLTIETRQAIFAAVVEAQDRHRGDVVQARQRVARKFKVTEGDVRRIEDEGLARDWPMA